MSRQIAPLVMLLALMCTAQLPVRAGEKEASAAYKKGDYITALRELRPLAEQGSANAQNQLGFMYANALGVPRDYDQAVSWFRKAVEQGDAGAQLNLALMYVNGLGVPQDYVQASALCRKAAEQGQAGAQYQLGLMYANGQGVPQDYAQALAWYRKAADQNHAGAQNNLGSMYYKGNGVPKDYSQALAWYRKAAEQGSTEAKNNLSNLKFEQPLIAQATKGEQTTVACDTLPGSGLDVPSDCLHPRGPGGVQSCESQIANDVFIHGRDARSYGCGDARSDYADCARQTTQAIEAYRASLRETQQREAAEYAKCEKDRIESGRLTRREIQERQIDADRLAARAGKPNTETVISKGDGGVVPGAIICPDYRTVGFVIDLYRAHVTDTLRDRLMPPGQSQLLRGPPTPEPNYSRYGCAMLPAGTPMILERGNVVPVVSAKLPNGSMIKGVTDPSMVRR